MDERKRAKPSTPERYLWPKPGARNLWFRLAVPRRFWSVETRRIVQRCLGTTDRNEASLRAAEARLRLIREWEIKLGCCAPASGEAIPSEADLHRAAATLGYVRMGESIAEWWAADKTDDDDCHARFIEKLHRRRARYIEKRETTELGLWRYVADAALTESGWRLPCPQTHDRFAQMVVEAAIDRMRVEIEQRTGNFGAEPKSRNVKAGLEALEQHSAPGEGMMELFERYAGHRLREGRKRTDTVKQDRKIVQQFAEFVGKSKSVKSLNQAEVREWRDCIAALPPMHRAANAYKGLTLPAAAAKARSLGQKPMSLTTVNKYLSTVSPFLGWCVRNGYAERNPCDGLFYDVPKGRNPRPPFSAEQFQQILSSPLFTGFECDGREHQPGQQRADDWRFWIPLVCLFTGARIGEIAQLRIDDVQNEGEIPFITIRHDESRGQKTKSGQTRLMPLHSKLVEIGFLRFVKQEVERSAADGNPQLFASLRPNERSAMGAVPSRFWRDYLRRIGIKSKADGLGSHSFRHALADRLRIAGYLNEEIKVALGHNQKSVTSGYGIVRQGTVRRIHDMIEQLKFNEIDLGKFNNEEYKVEST